jgi:hypothetical protein
MKHLRSCRTKRYPTNGLRRRSDPRASPVASGSNTVPQRKESMSFFEKLFRKSKEDVDRQERRLAQSAALRPERSLS